MNVQALTKQVISKSPSELRALLWQTAIGSPDWATFLRQAEGAAWIAFPERIQDVNAFAVQEKYNVKSSRQFRHTKSELKFDNKKQKLCKFHGQCQHRTTDCSVIKKLKEMGWDTR